VSAAVITSRGAPRRALLLAVTALLCLGCAGGTGETGEQRASLDVLTGDELRETGAANLWDALRQRRAQWLRARATTSLISPRAEEPVVYVQGIRHGPLTSLQQMNLDRVRRVEFIDGRDATTRFGTGHGGGVIMVDLDRS
jgi:hypothetical protein